MVVCFALNKQPLCIPIGRARWGRDFRGNKVDDERERETETREKYIREFVSRVY